MRLTLLFSVKTLFPAFAESGAPTSNEVTYAIL